MDLRASIFLFQAETRMMSTKTSMETFRILGDQFQLTPDPVQLGPRHSRLARGTQSTSPQRPSISPRRIDKPDSAKNVLRERGDVCR